MIAKYARVMNTMREMAEGLTEQHRFFNGDEAAQTAIAEAVRALEGSAAQMRSAWAKHSNEPNPLTTTKR